MNQSFDQDFAVEQYGNDREKMGWKKGWERGWKKGWEDGLEEGLKEGYLTAHFNLVRDGLLPVSIAAREVGMNEDLFLSMMNRPKPEEAEQESGT